MSRLAELSSDDLLGLVVGQRWFAAKDREPEGARVAGIAHEEGGLTLPFVEVRLPTGTHETYLLALAIEGEAPVDALASPAHVRRLAHLCGVETPCTSVRPMGVEQSNSSVVLDERYALKLYRRLEAGPNPELELLRALSEAGFPNAPGLVGAWEFVGEPLEAVLAVVTELVPADGGGWELTLESLAAGDSDWLPLRARRLGEVTGAMHAAFAASADPYLAPEEPSAEAVGLLAATVDEEIERFGAEVPESGIGPRIEDLRDVVQSLARVGPPGLSIRIHGDYHLGQVLWTTTRDWSVLDFEGEPGRSLAERRRRTFALRDVAGMMRSFAYAAEGALLLSGVQVPEGWEWSCRAAFLDGYRATVDERLLPSSEAGLERLLALFELQKLLYELRYELGHRPDWATIPAAGLERLLESA